MDTYLKGGVVTAIIGFIVLWIYAISSWGLLIGLMIGWFPAAIGAVVLGIIWPVVAVVAFFLYLKFQGAF